MSQRSQDLHKKRKKDTSWREGGNLSDIYPAHDRTRVHWIVDGMTLMILVESGPIWAFFNAAGWPYDELGDLGQIVQSVTLLITVCKWAKTAQWSAFATQLES